MFPSVWSAASSVAHLVLVALVASLCDGVGGQEAAAEASNAPSPTSAVAPSTASGAVESATESNPLALTERTAGASLSGQWGEWTGWSTCSRTCGVGYRRRTHVCLRGVCLLGETEERKSCNLRTCEQTGDPLQWSAWTTCSAPCGGGTTVRKRCRTADCTSHDRLTRVCNTSPCGERASESTVWTAWSDWAACTVDCTATRTRSCPAGRGQCGSERAESSRRCTAAPCTGQWSRWSPWTACSVTCGSGSGQQRRTRSCPRGALPTCPGNGDEQRRCSARVACARWTDWSRWSDCDGSCSNARQNRQRRCQGGEGSGRCVGNTLQERQCAPSCTPSSARDGTWLQWSDWSDCSRTCGSGARARVRSCSGQCQTGSDRQVERCNTSPCGATLAQGRWRNWSSWGTCSRTCGRGGRETRHRTCSRPSACSGSTLDTRSCYRGECEVGRWQEWGLWSQCSVSCGNGNTIRTRDCGQGDCHGHLREVMECKQMKCEGSLWAEWSEWSSCSISCGVGNAVRTRACLGNYCLGSLRETKSCADKACPGSTLPATTATIEQAGAEHVIEATVPGEADRTTSLATTKSCSTVLILSMAVLAGGLAGLLQ